MFNFNCQLPTELPCSFEGLFGRIRYSVRVNLDQPWKMDHVAKQPVTIISTFDLNHCPVAMVSAVQIVQKSKVQQLLRCEMQLVSDYFQAPVKEESTKTFWGQSKPLFMSVDIPVRGFVPGQMIPIKVYLDNESEVQVKSLEATLKQVGIIVSWFHSLILIS